MEWLPPRIEGTPQGSPLSPLLSNILLNELDTILEERGHHFVRYADDCSIYVGSSKSAHRVMERITVYLEGVLKLKVNREKSKVSTPTRSSLLGFSFYRKAMRWKTRIAPKSLKGIKQKIRQHTQRRKSVALHVRMTKLDAVIRGWTNYFSIADGQTVMQKLDGMTRIRLRIVIWKEWKNASTRMRHLINLGISKNQAYQWSHSRKSYCRTANSKVLMISLTKDYFSRLKYVGFENYYYWKTKHQTKLF